MKTISGTNLAKLSQQYGTEVTVVLAINWADTAILDKVTGALSYSDGQISAIISGGAASITYFADKNILDDSGNVIIPGKIISVSSIESSVDFNGNSTSTTVDVVLDDSDETILGFLGKYNIQRRLAYIYLYFEGMNLGDMILAFEGELVSGFSWSDKNHTAKFSIVNHIEEKEVGFSPEQGYIEDLTLDQIGKPWPFAFGTIIKLPALQLNYSPTAITTAPIGIHDWSLNRELTRISQYKDLYLAIAQLDFFSALGAYFSGLNDLGDQLTDEGNSALILYQTVVFYAQSIETILSEQLEFEFSPKDTMEVISNVPIKLKGDFQIGDIYIQDSTLDPNVGQGTAIFTFGTVLDPPGGSQYTLPYQTPEQKDPFVYVQAGAQIKFLGLYHVKYVVNCLGGTINAVYAHRQLEGANRLMPVPKKYWEVIQIQTIPDGIPTTVPVFTALGIQLKQLLSAIPFQGWDDDLYVSFTSNVGPSFHDIMTFLISNYTIYSVDSSLSSVPNFNCSFAMQEQKDLMQLIKEICFQCSVAVWLSKGSFHFQWLPQFNSIGMHISLSDIIADTLEIGISSTENIITKIRASWFFTYEFDTRNYLQMRYNDWKYGVKTLDVEYYCFQDTNPIMQSMLFWLYRKGNTWKRLKFSVPLRFIQLDLFDNVQLGTDVVNKYLLGTPSVSISASVVGLTLNPDTYLVDLELELPIYSGSLKNSPAYWLSSYAGQFYQIDQSYGLTEKPEQTIAYQRGEKIAIAAAGIRLNLETEAGLGVAFGTTVTLSPPNPDPVVGDPSRSFFTKDTQTDTGGQVQQGNTGIVLMAPQQSKQFVIGTKPFWNYGYPDFPTQQQPTASPSNTAPGQVIGISAGNDNDSSNGVLYDVNLFIDGTSKPPMSTMAILLQDAQDDKPIPKGTWAIFVQAGNPADPSQTNNTEATATNWYFQVPVWLGPSST